MLQTYMRIFYLTQVYTLCDIVMHQIISVVISYALSNLKAFYEVVKVCIYVSMVYSYFISYN